MHARPFKNMPLCDAPKWDGLPSPSNGKLGSSSYAVRAVFAACVTDRACLAARWLVCHDLGIANPLPRRATTGHKWI
jgi:hypothetical protein